MLQLNPPIPVYVPGRGTGLAHALIDYGPEYHLHWVVILDDGGEIWTLANPEVRGQVNRTMGRTRDTSNGTEDRPAVAEDDRSVQ